jgi:pSer/pThr/pTyr-binding forkhead associated (FHA) protein
MAKSPKPSQPDPPADPPVTSIKTIEMVVEESAPDPQGAQPKPPTETIRVVPPEPVALRPAIPFRPMARPKVAMLTVCDDGKSDGEVIRIRGHRFIIGRTEGDLFIPIDGRISARHVEITLQTIGGVHHRWVITDLQSTHGLFVRVSRTRLDDQAEFLVGSGRYRLDAPQYAAGVNTDDLANEPGFSQTHGWADVTSPHRPPALTELLGHEIGNRVLLVKPEYWIGADPTCAICRADDPFCEPRHVRLYRKANGAWHAENNKTQNGLWVRMSQITVESLAQFQIGEQRFQLRVK